MKIARMLFIVALAAMVVPLYAQTPCTWNETQAGKITETCGTVGAGTSTPWGGLHVFGAGQTASNPTVTSTSQSINGSSLFLQDSLNAPGNGGMLVFGAAAGHFAAIKGAIADGSNNTIGNMIFATRNASTDAILTERMRITSDGRVAMGTTNPGPSILTLLQTSQAGGWAIEADFANSLSANGSTGGKGALITAKQNVAAGVFNSGGLEATHITASNTGAGRISNIAGAAIYSGNEGNGTVDYATGAYIQVINGTGGTITNGYGLYVADVPATTAYGVFQGGSNDVNYFAGKVGIGTASPAYQLHVVGNARVDGELTGQRITAHYQDVAEWVPSREDLAPGTVVVLDSTVSNMVVQSAKAYDTTVAGVVSEQPGIVLGIGDASKEQVATTR